MKKGLLLVALISTAASVRATSVPIGNCLGDAHNTFISCQATHRHHTDSKSVGKLVDCVEEAFDALGDCMKERKNKLPATCIAELKPALEGLAPAIARIVDTAKTACMEPIKPARQCTNKKDCGEGQLCVIFRDGHKGCVGTGLNQRPVGAQCKQDGQCASDQCRAIGTGKSYCVARPAEPVKPQLAWF